jgi:hypothetical protein
MPAVTPEREQIERLVRGEHHEPHRLLGAHLDGNQVTIRAWRPDRRRRDVADGRERERDRSDDEAGQPQDRGVTDRDRRDLGALVSIAALSVAIMASSLHPSHPGLVDRWFWIGKASAAAFRADGAVAHDTRTSRATTNDCNNPPTIQA